jgi:hypothetical protein
VLNGEDLDVSPDAVKIPGYARSINLNISNPYADMTEDD